MKKLKEPLIIKIFLIIYFIFSTFLIITFLITKIELFSIIKYVLILLLVGFGIYLMRHKQLPNLRNSYYLLLALAIFFHIILLFLPYKTPVSDYASFYNNAVSIAKNNTFFDAKYIALFPHLGGYIFLIGLVMKVLSTKYFVYVLVNILFDFFGSFIIYQIFKRQNETELGKIGSLIWLLNPINIVWCSACIPVIVFQNLFLLIIYLFQITISSWKKMPKFLLYSFLLGIILGIANLFRPIIIVVIIAIFLYYFYLFLSKYKIWPLLISILLILIPYFTISKINTAVISNISGYEVSGMPGWNVYVGSTGKCGKWTTKVGKEFDNKIREDDFKTANIHQYFLNKGVKNYQNRSLNKNISFISAKFKFLSTNINGLTTKRMRVQVDTPKILLDFIDFTSIIFVAFCFLSMIGSNLKYLKNNQNKMLLFYDLLIIGCTLAHLLLEVSPRYFIPVLCPILVCGLTFFKKEVK